MEPDTRLDFEAAISRWRAVSELDSDALDELETHLRDACADGIARGLAPAGALRAALAQLGDPAQLSAEFSKLQQNHSPNIMLTSLIRSPRVRRHAWHIAIVLLLAIQLRVFAIAPYRVAGACVAPEIPAGSHLLVWRIAPTFAPSDIAAFRNGAQTWLGRVTAVSATGLTVVRTDEPARSIPRADIVGRVILATR